MAGMLTQKKAAEAMGVSLRTVQRWQKKGTLKVCKYPGSHITRIHPDEVRRLILAGFGRSGTA